MGLLDMLGVGSGEISGASRKAPKSGQAVVTCEFCKREHPVQFARGVRLGGST